MAFYSKISAGTGTVDNVSEENSGESCNESKAVRGMSCHYFLIFN